MKISLVRVRYGPLLVSAAVAIAGVGLWQWFDRSSQSSRPLSAQASPEGDRVSALGRLEPKGEVIQVFAPTSLDGARVEKLSVRQGQMLKQGETIAILDTYARRQAALGEAQRQVAIAEARLAQVEAGVQDGEIAAQERVARRFAVELETEVAAQEATIARLNAELANAERENRRFQFLQAEGAVSDSIRDIVVSDRNETLCGLSWLPSSALGEGLGVRASLSKLIKMTIVVSSLPMWCVNNCGKPKPSSSGFSGRGGSKLPKPRRPWNAFGKCGRWMWNWLGRKCCGPKPQ